MRSIICGVAFMFLISCNSSSNQPEKQGFSSGQLVHTVLLKFKDGTSEERKAKIKSTLETLGDIKEPNGFFVATPADTPDPRAVKNYDFILQMAFNSTEELAKYSTNSFHLEVRNQIKDELSATPLVFDYWVE